MFHNKARYVIWFLFFGSFSWSWDFKILNTDPVFIKFREECSKTGTTEEAIAVGEKMGLQTELKPVNPLNPDEKVPVYFANFVLMGYGFGAVFGYHTWSKRLWFR